MPLSSRHPVPDCLAVSAICTSNYRNAWDDLDEIQTRFIDALSWHSDAISEQDPALGALVAVLKNGRLVVR